MESTCRTFRLSLLILLAGIGAACASGCQSLPRSGFDPTGERLFESCPLQGLRWPECSLFGQRSDAQPTSVTATPIPVPVSATTPGTDGSTGLLPGHLGAAKPGSASLPQYGSTATAADPALKGINTALVASPDAGPSPMFEETGGYALPTVPVEGPALLMTPREQIAPVGSEVVLISSYLGKKDRLITNEKVEWTLEGVGSIMKFDKGSYCDPLYFDYTRAKKISERYTVTKTSQVYQTLDRGTPETKDDVHLLRGQTWVSVNSMREGTTHVTAFAPSLKDWSKRTDVGIIHWVDAQWVLPRLPISPVGESRVLTTTVLRRTNGQPRRGWIVRYEILNGPSAGFLPSMAQIEEVETDLSGQASIVLSQRELQSGTNSIAIRIIRPAGIDGADRRVTVGSETVRQTWTGTAGVRIRIQGPPNAAIGNDIPYTITLTNNGPTTAQGIVALTIPPLASFISGAPTPLQQDAQSAQWNVTIPPGGNSTLQAVLRQGTAGKLMPVAKFYPQGMSPSPTVTPSITGTSVPTPGSGSLGAITDPASTVPTLPGSSGASIYQPGSAPSGVPSGSGATPYSPSTPSPSTTPGAIRFEQPNLALSIDMSQNARPRIGSPCQVSLTARNNASSEIRNVVLQLDIPKEYNGRLEAILATQGYQQNGRNNVSLTIPSIPAGGTAELEMQLPEITQQGYRFTGRALVDGKSVAETQKTIAP